MSAWSYYFGGLLLALAGVAMGVADKSEGPVYWIGLPVMAIGWIVALCSDALGRRGG